MNKLLSSGIGLVGLAALAPVIGSSVSLAYRPNVPKEIKAYNIDFNWGPGGPNEFAKPGLWAEADPAEHVAWYKALGCNLKKPISYYVAKPLQELKGDDQNIAVLARAYLGLPYGG